MLWGLKGVGRIFRGLILVDLVQHLIELENLLQPIELAYPSPKDLSSVDWLPLPPTPPLEIEDIPGNYNPGPGDLGVLYGESKWVLCLYGLHEQRNNFFYGTRSGETGITLLKEQNTKTDYLRYIWLKGPISSIGLAVQSSETRYGNRLHYQSFSYRSVVYCYGRGELLLEPALTPAGATFIGFQQYGLGTAYEKRTEFQPNYAVFSDTETEIDVSKFVSNGQIVMTNRFLGMASTTYRFTTGNHFLLPLYTEDGTPLLEYFPGNLKPTKRKEEMTCPNIRPQLATYQKNIEAALAAQTSSIQSKLDQNVSMTSSSISAQLSGHQSQLLNGFNQLRTSLTGSFNSFQSSVSTSFSGLQVQLNNALSQTTSNLSQSLEGISLKLDAIKSTLGEFFEKFNKFLKWSLIDRVLTVLTFITILHNAYMLSNDLVQTLFSAASNLLTAGGNALGLRDVEDQPINVGEIIGNTFEGIAKTLLGTETLEGMKAEWRKYNRIYQAAANLLSSLQSIYSSILGVLEVLGSGVAKIGNALQRWGVVGEKALGWMNPNPNFDDHFSRTVEKIQTFVGQVDSIASEILSTQQTFAELTKQKDELKESVEAAGKVEEAKQMADKEASKGPEINKSDLTKPTN